MTSASRPALHGEDGPQASEVFRLAFDEAPIGACVIGPDRRHLRVNRHLCEMLGYPEAELLGKPFTDLLHPDDVAACALAFERVIKGEVPSFGWEARFVRRDGQVGWARVHGGLLHASSAEPHAIADIVDITAEKEAETARLRVSRYARGLIEASPDPLVTIAPDGKISVEASWMVNV